jgi:hypothetical protein
MEEPAYDTGSVVYGPASLTTNVEFDIYPVGLFLVIRTYRGARRTSKARSRAVLFSRLYDPIACARAGNWRAAKNFFNGYLAEPKHELPNFIRCGSGWTKKRAVRSFWKYYRGTE